MKVSALIIFLSLVTLIYGLVNYYIFIRGLQAFIPGSPGRLWFTIGFWSMASTFILARILERTCPCMFTGIITWIGSFWLAFMLYFFLIVLILDISRIANHFFHCYPRIFFSDYARTKMLVFLASVILVSILVAAGYINARTPRIKVLNLHIRKTVAGCKTLKIVMASDIHLGTLIAKRKAGRLVRSINALHPDIVLFAGDLVDEDLAPVIHNNLGSDLVRINSRLGVFAIPGNHEYIGGAESAINYLSNHGITMLRDTCLLIHDCFYLIGRDDRDKPRFSGKPRKELSSLMKGIDLSRPVILMDHQPFHLEQSAALGVDLQLSGHTHHGQLWPLNYFTSAIYEISQGYKQIGKTHFYVSTGFGTWGPPIRLGNRPEIVQISLTFN